MRARRQHRSRRQRQQFAAASSSPAPDHVAGVGQCIDHADGERLLRIRPSRRRPPGVRRDAARPRGAAGTGSHPAPPGRPGFRSSPSGTGRAPSRGSRSTRRARSRRPGCGRRSPRRPASASAPVRARRVEESAPARGQAGAVQGHQVGHVQAAGKNLLAAGEHQAARAVARAPPRPRRRARRAVRRIERIDRRPGQADFVDGAVFDDARSCPCPGGRQGILTSAAHR